MTMRKKDAEGLVPAYLNFPAQEIMKFKIRKGRRGLVTAFLIEGVRLQSFGRELPKKVLKLLFYKV